MGFFNSIKDLIGGATDLAQGSIGEAIGGLTDIPLVQEVQDIAGTVTDQSTDVLNTANETKQNVVDNLDLTNKF